MVNFTEKLNLDSSIITGSWWGGGAEPQQPRWSVIRDVLSWVD
jgi:hypothetical protein